MPQNPRPQPRAHHGASHINFHLGKPDANINRGATGTVSIWRGQPGSEADTGADIDAFALDAGVLEGQWVVVTWIQGNWYVGPYLTNEQLGKPDANIAKGASGTVSIWRGAAGSETDSGVNVTACARGAAVTSGKWVSVACINGAWYVAPWEC